MFHPVTVVKICRIIAQGSQQLSVDTESKKQRARNVGRFSQWLCFAVAFLLSSPIVVAQFGQPYSVYGSSDLDMAACNQAGPVGEISSTFWILRRYDIAGPTQVLITNLPANVSASVSPTTLTYPGAVTGQEVTATFTVNAGVAIPDIVVQIEVSDATNKVNADLLLHGTCPRHNKDFVIRGWFASIHRGVPFPVEGALVEIYRDVPWHLDQHVGSTITQADGSFEMKLWANDEDTYYAKLRLNDVAGVYMHDWWTTEIKDYNSFNRGSNSQRDAAKLHNCKEIPCKTFVANLIRPQVLRGQIAYANLFSQAFSTRYATLRASNKATEISDAVIERERAQREGFRRSTLKIVLQTLNSSARALALASQRDSTGKVREIAATLRRTARRLQLRAPINDELFTLLALPSAPDDDQTGPAATHK